MNSRDAHKGWNDRGYLPHFDAASAVQGITFRLHDSIPRRMLTALESDAKLVKSERKRAAIQKLLDRGYGECYFKIAEVAREVEDALLYFDRERYRLIAWVVMPNHVHCVIEQVSGWTLAKVLHSWKSYSGKQAWAVLERLGHKRGKHFWHRDYFDRFVRDEEHLGKAIQYVEYNPVKAGLCENPEDWPFSSASRRLRE
jgi:putative transposase